MNSSVSFLLDRKEPPKTWDEFFDKAANHFWLSESEALSKSKFRGEVSSPEDAWDELEEFYLSEKLSDQIIT